MEESACSKKKKKKIRFKSKTECNAFRGNRKNKSYMCKILDQLITKYIQDCFVRFVFHFE